MENGAFFKRKTENNCFGIVGALTIYIHPSIKMILTLFTIFFSSDFLNTTLFSVGILFQNIHLESDFVGGIFFILLFHDFYCRQIGFVYCASRFHLGLLGMLYIIQLQVSKSIKHRLKLLDKDKKNQV